jgi:hypothetical protein
MHPVRLKTDPTILNRRLQGISKATVSQVTATP